MHSATRLAKLGLFDAKVPRYTSYPTAPRFAGGVGPEQVIDWVSTIAPGSRISLYVHIPFCRKLCWFCACRTQGTRSEAPVAAYLDTLKSEISLLARSLPDGVSLSRLHWGGGTPTLLAPGMIAELAGSLTDLAPLAPNAEFSVEVDPNELDQDRVDALAAAGMTRASIGVQDFDPDIQAVIGRQQGFEITRDAAAMLRAAGITSLNADILFGLPHQTQGRITASVQKLLTLSPDRVALFGYAHVPWMARRQSLIPTDALPTPQDRLLLFETARHLFLWDDYREIGIDHFARPHDALSAARDAGTLRRNFQGYTDDAADVLIGLGASAISRFPQGYAQNATATSQHVGAIRQGRFSTARGHRLSVEDRLRGRIIEALMCDFQIDLTDLRSRFPEQGIALKTLFARAAETFGDLLELSEDHLRIRHEARPLARIIARHFDAYESSSASPQAYSSAI